MIHGTQNIAVGLKADIYMKLDLSDRKEPIVKRVRRVTRNVSFNISCIGSQPLIKSLLWNNSQ